MTNAFVQMSGVFAELELRIIRERVRSGMQNAKAKGGKSADLRRQLMKFRKFSIGCPSYKAGNLNVSELARVCELRVTTVYKYISLLDK